MKNVKPLVTEARSIVRLRRWMRSIDAGTALASDGFEVVEPLVPAAERDELRDVFERALYAEVPSADSGAYVVSRQLRSTDRYDKNVFQLMNAQRVVPWLDERYTEPIEDLFEARLGTRLHIQTYSIQLDRPDVVTKRPFHNDGFSVNYKLFVYLTDVDGPEHGPYTVVPGSHRHYVRKYLNVGANVLVRKDSKVDDMTVGYSDEKAHRFCGPAGTTIASCQALAHKGWPEHRERDRLVLIVYLGDKPRTTDWTLGRALAIDAPIERVA